VLLAVAPGWFLAAGCAAPPHPGQAAQPPAVGPEINDPWRSSDIGPLVSRAESESREIYVHRELLAAVAGPVPGSVVADVGAGTGFMSLLFSRLVGPAGRVYAVDLNPALMDHVTARAREQGIDNIRTVVCTDRSVELPPASVDMVFLCDTYHHFEYPMSTMGSIHDALRPGGQVVVVEFERIPGASRPWILDHVRAGEEVFTREILDCGFELINRHDLPVLEETYVLRFRKGPARRPRRRARRRAGGPA
jgi:SAM-dependent methyltransferase